MLELYRCEHSGKSKFYTQTPKYLQATHFQPSICKQYLQIHCSKFTLLWSHTGKAQHRQLMYTVSCHNMNCKQLEGIVQLTASGQELQTEKRLLLNVNTEQICEFCYFFAEERTEGKAWNKFCSIIISSLSPPTSFLLSLVETQNLWVCPFTLPEFSTLLKLFPCWTSTTQFHLENITEVELSHLLPKRKRKLFLLWFCLWFVGHQTENIQAQKHVKICYF